MPRKDIIAPAQEEEQQVPHRLIIDPNADIVGMSLPAAAGLLELDSRLLEVVGLLFVYTTYYKLYNKMPTVEQLGEMGAGSAPRIAAIRKVAKEHGYMKVHTVREKGKIVAKHTYLTVPILRNLNVRKHGGIIINNNILPDSAGQKSGDAPLGLLKSKETTPKEFPRESDFNTLWSANERKVNKDESKKAWKSKPVQSSLPPIGTLVEAYQHDSIVNKWNLPETDEKFIPHLSTWLRGRRWENYTGEVIDSKGGIHIMQQLNKADGIKDAKQLRAELNDQYVPIEKRGDNAPKTLIRAYVKWLEGPDPPPATDKQSIKDVLIFIHADKEDSFYWKAYVKAGMPGLTKKEMF